MPLSSLRSGLTGRRGLRREIAGLGAERANAIQNQLSDIDPKRFRSLYRQRAEQIMGQERNAQPVTERMELEQLIGDRTKNLTSSQRDVLNDKLRRNGAGFGSAAERNSPYRWGSVAQQQFGSLYRR